MLLLAEGKPVALARLIDAVWDRSAPSTATKQIRNAVSDLRQRLACTGVTIRAEADGYRLDRAESRLDAEEFAEQVSRARLEPDPDRATVIIRNALALWRGPALAGLTSPVLRTEVTNLEEARLAALESRVEWELGLGRHAALIGELTAAVAEHPYRERLVGQLMVALCRAGIQARALEVFEATRRLLRDELGVDPEPQLQELHLRILSSDLLGHPHDAGHVAGDPSWQKLPGDMVKLTGRSREVGTVRQALRRQDDTGGRPPAPALVVIDGMAGVGKTAFALELGRVLAPDYPDGQLFVDLSTCGIGGRPVDVSAALATLLRETRVPVESIPPDLAGRRAAWRHRLSGRRVLVIFDDVEATDQIQPALVDVPGCLTIVTGRRRLTRLNPTFQLSLPEFSLADGRDLFGSVVGDDRPQAESAAVDEILRQCGRLPLAIRNAAVRLRHRHAWSVSYLASRLADGRHRLAELSTESSGVAEAFDRSFYQLDPESQQLFRLLGNLDNQDVEADQIAALSGLPVSRAARLLEEMVDSHLLNATGHGRYRMNELLHAYSVQLV